MFKALAFFIGYFVTGINIMQNISQNYYLFRREFTSLYLNQYFTGDSLSFKISTNSSILPPVFLSNSSTLISKLPKSGQNIIPPSKTTLIRPICQYYQRYCETVYLGTDSILIIFSFDAISGFNQILHQVYFFDPIKHYLLLKYLDSYSIFVVTQSESTNKSSYFNVSFIYDKNGILVYQGMTQLALSKFYENLIVDDLCQFLSPAYLALSGTNGTHGVITGLDLNDSFKEAPVFFIDLSIFGDQILLSTDYKHLFALVQSKNKVFKLSVLNNLTLVVLDSIYLPELNGHAYSFGFSEKITELLTKLYIVIGSRSRALVVSSDFTEVYVKNVTTEPAEVYCYSSNTDYFCLVKKAGDFSIHFIQIQENFDEIFAFDLGIKGMHATAWLASDYYNQEYFFIVLNKTSLNFFLLYYLPAHLNFTCAESEQTYILSVSDNQGAQIDQTFSVTPILLVEQAIPLPNSASLVALFEDLQSKLTIRVTDYFGGSGYTNASLVVQDQTFNENFNQSIEFNQLFPEVNQKIIYLLGHNYTRIVKNENGFLLFNKTTVGYFSQEKVWAPIMMTEIEIIDIQYVNTSFYLLYCKGTNFGLNFVDFVNQSTQCTNNLAEKCIQVRNLWPYAGCNVGQYILIYENIEKLTVKVARTMNLTSDSEIVDFCMINASIVAINSSGFILIYNLDNVVRNMTKPVEPVFIKYIGRGLVHVLADSLYYYLYFQDGYLKVYDSWVNYVKTTVIIEASKLIASNNWIFSNTFNSDFKISDLHGYLMNSLLYSDELYEIIDFDTLLDSVVILFEDNIYYLTINKNFYTIDLIFNIQENSSISQLACEYNTSLIMTQKNGNIDTEVNNTLMLVLMINGQTIFYNQTAQKQIESQLKLPCGSEVQIPLDEIFLGQGINVSSSSTDNLVKIHPRLSQYYDTNNYYNISKIIYIQYAKIYIAVIYPNVIMLFDEKFKNMNKNKEVTAYGYFCQILSIAAVYVDESVDFIVGVECLYQGNQTPEFFEYQIFFIEFLRSNYLETFSLTRQFVKIKPSLIKTSLTISGNFIIVITTTYQYIINSGFISNILGICYGSLKLGSISIFCGKLLTPSYFSLSSMYIVDLDLIFYPSLKNYYIYLLDISGILAVIESSEKTEIKDVNFVKLTSSADSYPVSLERCGQYVYIGYNTNMVLVYFLLNFKSPQFDRSIGPFGTDFYMNPGSIQCSDLQYSKYLLLTMMKDFFEFYVQVIDTTANELSSLVTQSKFELNSSQPLMVFALFSSSENISILTSDKFVIFQVQDYVMTVSSHVCSKKSVDFMVIAKNDYNYTKSAYFTAKILKDYSSGSVSVGLPASWIVILIILAVLLIIISIYLVIRFLFNKKFKIKSAPSLFNYEYFDFISD